MTHEGREVLNVSDDQDWDKAAPGHGRLGQYLKP